MALTKRQFAEKLRTMNRSGSKAPLQGVKLPTNQSSYRTPSMSTGGGGGGAQPQGGANPAQLAKVGGLLGKIGKQWYDSHKEISPYWDKAVNPDAMGQGFTMGVPDVSHLMGDEVDMALGEANNVMDKFDFASPAGMEAGLPAGAGEWGGIAMDAGELANPAGITDAASQVNDVLNGVDMANASNFQLPGVGTALGIGANAANGNWGKAGAQAAGATIGSFVPGFGTGAGAAIGGMLYDLGDRWL